MCVCVRVGGEQLSTYVKNVNKDWGGLVLLILRKNDHFVHELLSYKY